MPSPRAIWWATAHSSLSACEVPMKNIDSSRLTVWPLASLRIRSLSPDLLDAAGDLFKCPFPALFLPLVAARGPVHGFLQPVLVARHAEHGRSLGAEGPLVDGVIRVALCADQFAVLDVGDDVAAHRAEGANADDLLGAFDLERLYISPHGLDIDAQLEQRQADNARPAHLHEFPPIDLHGSLLSSGRWANGWMLARFLGEKLYRR